jgi:hypothetical protein
MSTGWKPSGDVYGGEEESICTSISKTCVQKRVLAPMIKAYSKILPITLSKDHDTIFVHIYRNNEIKTIKRNWYLFATSYYFQMNTNLTYYHNEFEHAQRILPVWGWLVLFPLGITVDNYNGFICDGEDLNL